MLLIILYNQFIQKSSLILIKAEHCNICVSKTNYVIILSDNNYKFGKFCDSKENRFVNLILGEVFVNEN